MKKYVVRRTSGNRYLVTDGDKKSFYGPWGSNDVNEATKYDSHHEAMVSLFQTYENRCSRIKDETGLEIVQVREISNPRWEVVE